MALHRSSLSGRRGSKNDSTKDEDETENNGYVQVLVKPLEQGNCTLILNWLGVTASQISCQHTSTFYGIILVTSSVILYNLLKCDVGYVFHRLCGICVPLFTIVCSFYWLSLFLRKTWSCTSIYLLFASCFVGETIAQILIRSWNGVTSPSSDGDSSAESYSHVTQPLVVFVVLLAVCTSSVFSTLETQHSVAAISLVSFTRFLACSTLGDIPQSIRPYISYICGLVGIFISKYMETILKPPINNFMTQDGKIPAYKRRSSTSSQGFPAVRATANHTRDRRVSLPALGKSQSSSSFESAILGEAHGLITDMLADQTLPLNIVSGLRTLSNLLKPPENHSSFHKTRVSPLVSLTESSNYGSDTEENPYTGERPSSKKSRRSLPPSLIRRMSTSTWTTTTSATGMPTLELEPCRIRSSSFRHNRDGTPGSSPVGSRSNSPSPSSPTVVLTIPKSRSFSLVSPTPQSSHLKRPSRKSVLGVTEVSGFAKSSEFKQLSPLVKDELDFSTQDKGDKGSNKDPSSSFRRINMTSDYESNDSPNSSDHSDTCNVTTFDDVVSGSPPKKVVYSHGSLSNPNLQKSWVIHDSRLKESSDMAEDADEEDENDHETEEIERKKSAIISCRSDSASDSLPWDCDRIDDISLLHIHRLNEWDYPIFDLSNKCRDTILSKVAYKLFMEVGLFETFRIPVAPFLHYFHALEQGYRDKPYHNRIHATDVLHGVYYLTTQPIPGFTQVSTSNMFCRNGSSSDSDGENTEKHHLTHRANSFVAEDYGIMGGNFPALELMALYTAAAMHDFDHPGRTNAFLVATNAKEAVLYNDRSVLENHHVAQAWSLFMKEPVKYNFLCGLEAAEFKRFRFLVIENILATDLKRHFEILAEFNAKVNDEEAVGLDWTSETDRLLVMQMVIKLADINGPAKTRDLHTRWTHRISEEFYEQGDEEQRLGMPISPYMDRKVPQLAKLQETFINHLVAPLCNAMVTAGLLPGTWVDEDDNEEEEEEGQSDSDQIDNASKDTEDEDEDTESGSVLHQKCKKKPRKVNCLLTKNMKENHEYWVGKIQEEEKQKAAGLTNSDSHSDNKQESSDVKEMESIKEEVESQASNNSSQPSTPTKENAQQEKT